ncbi:LysR family transcriptional regulator substrate-binding protein [Dietzia sp. SL131]|uniref:LysR family transcriptional regulator substrate-binding protein n=1 Tax=Dietzia sp. SL131 TaxID=2995149 RepID=UPI00227B0D47|nr:LysR family transcriptional regulator substrate-binding protein [Dietzia sp. SL131]MCY1657371.1 LysR family transcriptional regulator substrate-binding protein [Dietzia sp. SL131]
MTDENTGNGPRLRVGYVPGVQPDKWLARWRERNPRVPISARRAGDPRAELADSAGDDGFDVIFLREPDDAPRSAPAGLLRVPLYTETMAVLAEKDHELAAFDSLGIADLEGERWLEPVDPITASPEEVSAAVDLVAAGVGLLVLPAPYARALSRRDVVARPVDGVPATRMGIAWSPARETDELIDEFVGIVRGRRAGTSRGAAGEPPREKRTAKEKAAAKAKARSERAPKPVGRAQRRR